MPHLRYAITNRTLYGETEAEHRAGLAGLADRLASENIDFIQLREKDLPALELIGLAREILSAIRSSHSATRLLVNARADVAVVCGAHGVHLPSGLEQLTPNQIRQLFTVAGAAKPIVSVSCHSLEEVDRARVTAADLILFGPVFGKFVAGKVAVPGTGLQALEAACERAGGTPVLALGGVNAANAPTAIAAGAKGIAAIRLFR